MNTNERAYQRTLLKLASVEGDKRLKKSKREATASKEQNRALKEFLDSKVSKTVCKAEIQLLVDEGRSS